MRTKAAAGALGNISGLLVFDVPVTVDSTINGFARYLEVGVRAHNPAKLTSIDCFNIRSTKWIDSSSNGNSRF